MISLRYHLLAVFFALRLEVRWRAGRPLVPVRRVGRGAGCLDDCECPLAVVASRRAVARICTLRSCLTRSIVLFQLLEGRFRARLELGFKPGADGPEGHAWVAVDGTPLGEPEGGTEAFSLA